MTARTILEQALKLSKKQRLKIAEELFDSALDHDALVAGAKLAEQRAQAYERGEIAAKPLAQVMNLRKRIGTKQR
jgi:Putative addiction module component